MSVQTSFLESHFLALQNENLSTQNHLFKRPVLIKNALLLCLNKNCFKYIDFQGKELHKSQVISLMVLALASGEDGQLGDSHSESMVSPAHYLSTANWIFHCCRTAFLQLALLLSSFPTKLCNYRWLYLSFIGVWYMLSRSLEMGDVVFWLRLPCKMKCQHTDKDNHLDS